MDPMSNELPEQQSAPVMADSKVTSVKLVMEECDGGAVLAAWNEQEGLATKKTAIVAGTSDSAAFQRKVQRTAVKWMKEFFTAPPRAGSNAASEAAAEAQPAAEPVAVPEG